MATSISRGLQMLVACLSLWAESSYGQNNVPVTQNLTFIAVRLMSNSPRNINQGRLEFQMPNEVWGTVCPASWNDTVTSSNVNTTCAMLGFRNGGKRVNNTFGEGNKNFIIENAVCPPNAISWYQCTQYFVKKCGPQDEELAVECNPDPTGVNYLQLGKAGSSPGTGALQAGQAPVNTVVLNGTSTATCTPSANVRLLGGDIINDTIGNGFVQVKVNDQWGYVCSSTWNQAAAQVVCKELCYESVAGFTPLPGVIAHTIPDQLNRVFALTSVNCAGNEASVLSCPVINSSAICSPDTLLAGVQCKPNCCQGAQCRTDYCDDKPIIMPDVNCSMELLTANFSKVRFPLITVSNIFMIKEVPRSCMNATSNNDGDVIVSVSVATGCGVDLQQNATHITYGVSLRLVWTSGTVVINAYINTRYEVVCSVPKNYAVSNRMQPYTMAPNITIYQQFNYSLAMDLFTTCNFTQPVDPIGSMYLVEVGQMINVAIWIKNYDNRTKLVLTDCDAYPVMPYISYAPVVKLIQDKCPVDPTLTAYHMDNRREGFQVKAFMFAGYSMVYIRCTVNICLLNATTPDCDRACSKPLSGRRKRSASNLGAATVDTKTIFMYNPSDTGMSKIIDLVNQNGHVQQVADPAAPSNTSNGTSDTRHNPQQVADPKETAPQNGTEAQSGDQQINQREEKLNGSSTNDEKPEQQQPDKQQEGNRSQEAFGKQGEASELVGDNPGSATYIRLNREMSTLAIVAWLAYLLVWPVVVNI